MVDVIAAGVLEAEFVPPPAGGAEHPPLSFAAKTLYAAGDGVDGVVSYAVGAFAFFYLTVVCGLSGSAAGLLLAVSIAVDAVMDPFIGFASDNTKSPWGRRHPFMLAAALPVFLGLGMLFSIPHGLTGGWLFGYVMAALLLLRISMSAFTLPYGALGAELSANYTERSTIVAFRSAFNILGNLLVVVIGLWGFLKGKDGLTHRDAYTPFAWSVAGIALAAALISTIFSLNQRHRLQQVTTTAKISFWQLFVELKDVFRNRSFLILFFCILAFWAAQGTIGVLNLHASKYFWKLPPEAIQTLPLVSFVGLATGIAVAGLVLQKVEKRLVSVWGLVIVCFLQMAPPVFRILHWLPEGGMPLYVILGSVLMVSGWAVTCVAVSFISMLADAADEHELLFGSRREGLYFAGLTFSAKAAIGLGSLVAGVALDLIHFPKDPEALAAAGRLSQGTVNNLGLIFGPGAGAIAMLSALILTGYKLDAKRYREIQAELAARKAAG